MTTQAQVTVNKGIVKLVGLLTALFTSGEYSNGPKGRVGKSYQSPKNFSKGK